MREIKFRQRNKNNGQWFYWGFVNGEWIDPMQQDNYDNPEDSDRFTGLHAKNGEIYEGDIAKTRHFTGYGTITEEHIGRVEYLPPGFCLVDKDEFAHEFAYEGDLDTGTEVIGNIYENKSLLREEK